MFVKGLKKPKHFLNQGTWDWKVNTVVGYAWCVQDLWINPWVGGGASGEERGGGEAFNFKSNYKTKTKTVWTDIRTAEQRGQK